MKRFSKLGWVVLSALAMAVALTMQSGVRTQSVPLSITLTGQSMLRGDIRVHNPEVVSTWTPLLKADVVFTNYEIAVAENQEWLKQGGFLSPPETLDALRDMGFNLVALANNHAFDMQVQGIQTTIRAAATRKLTVAGTGNTLAEAAAPAYLKTPNGTVALIAVASGMVEGDAATPSRAGINEMRIAKGGVPNAEDTQRILRSIREAREKSDLVIVSQHNHVFMDDVDFGTMAAQELPERLRPPDWMVKWTHDEIEAGADIIAMTGAPLLHGVEIHRGRPIFYDLGNFFFQYAPSGTNHDSNLNWQSVVAKVQFRGRQLESVTFVPLALNKFGQGQPDLENGNTVNLFRQTRGLPTPATGVQARFIFRWLAELSRPFGTTLDVKGDTARVILKPGT